MSRIIHLHDSSGLYGAESVILSLGVALKETGYDPVLGCLVGVNQDKPELGRVAEEAGLDVEYLPMCGKVDISVVLRLANVIRKRNIQLVHAHGYKSNMIGFLASRLAGIPMITTNHLFPPMPLDDRKLQFYSKVDASFTMKRLSRIVAVSTEIRDKLVAAGIERTRLSVIDNGVDIDKYARPGEHEAEQLRQSLGIGKGVFVVGTLGRLTQQKGQKYLLDAARIVLGKHVPVVFLIAGEGPLRGELETMAGEIASPGSIRFLGFRRDTADLLKIMDVFVMSSLDEGLPMSMIEAMASRTPVLVTSVGDIPKVIEDGVNGMLVDARDSAALADRLCRLLADANLRSELAARAFDDARTRYSKEAMCSRYVDIYGEVLGKNGDENMIADYSQRKR